MQITSKTGRKIQLPTVEEDVAINEGIDGDPDTFELSDEAFKTLRPVGRPKLEISKSPISIRLSPEVIDYFRATGKGWQTRIDTALLEYVKAHKSV